MLGQVMNLDGEPHEIIGVMPEGFFSLPEDAALWRPIRLDPALARPADLPAWARVAIDQNIGLGVLGAMGSSRFIESLLFEVAPRDPGTLVAVVVVLAVASAVACFLPARRATRVDVTAVLRCE